MTRIDSLEQYKLETDGYSDTFCILFVRLQSPPCLVMERVLSILCDKNDMKLLVIPVDNSDFYYLVEKYNVGILPRYLFIKEDKELHTDFGTQSIDDINKTLAKLEV